VLGVKFCPKNDDKRQGHILMR